MNERRRSSGRIRRAPFLPCRALWALGLLLLCFLLTSCADRTSSTSRLRPKAVELPPVKKLGYSVQVGAFAELANAVGLEQQLQQQGVDAYYFRHESGLYKVRFGSHGSYAAARRHAETLRKNALLGDYFIVIPDSYAAQRIAREGRGDLRAELVATARRFLGVPYRWGGEDRKGFDCSGLTMVSYRLNGLDLPRNSRAQYRLGQPVPRNTLQPGDLVFFATGGGRRVSHVGLYIGREQFIHAPRAGQEVRIADLTSDYFQRTYVGARSYLLSDLLNSSVN